MKCKRAIVRQPGNSVINGLSTSNLGLPDFPRLLQQHHQYRSILESCGVELIILDSLEAFPDSCFVEDTAVVNPNLAILTRPGASTREGEVKEIESTIRHLFPRVEQITAPGTLEGGDVLLIGNRYYIGLSERTNLEGANQFRALEEDVGYSVEIVPLKEMLHLKTGVNAVDEHTVLVAGEFRSSSLFEAYDRIEVQMEEAYAANCLNINGTIILPNGFPNILDELQNQGYRVKTVDMSEFQKIDGGLSCLSLRLI
ncbi:MAG: dimethylarginine dimethylaminohydrolase family protein [Promethearchaeota archaeon]